METATKDRIQEISDRWQKVTPWPWEPGLYDDGIGAPLVNVVAPRADVEPGVIRIVCTTGLATDGAMKDQSIDDATAIAAAPSDVAYLRDRIAALERERKWKYVDRDGLPTERGIYEVSFVRGNNPELAVSPYHPGFGVFNHVDVYAWREQAPAPLPDNQ